MKPGDTTDSRSSVSAPTNLPFGIKAGLRDEVHFVP